MGIVITEDFCKVVEENEVVKGGKKNNSLRFCTHWSKLSKPINQDDLERIRINEN